MSNTPPGEWEVSRWRIRVEQGRKGPDDRRIWVASPGGEYTLLTLATLGAITTLWFRNEQILYPPPRYLGGEKVLLFLADCCQFGLRRACVLHSLREPVVRNLHEPEEMAA
jgi:hypothetical protein